MQHEINDEIYYMQRAKIYSIKNKFKLISVKNVENRAQYTSNKSSFLFSILKLDALRQERLEQQQELIFFVVCLVS